MNGIIYEDEGFKRLLPLTWTRPVYDLVCGAQTLGDRIEEALPEFDFRYICRDYLSYRPDPKIRGRTLFVNGRVLDLGYQLRDLVSGSETGKIAFFVDGELAAAFLGQEEGIKFKRSGFNEDSLPREVEEIDLDESAHMIEYFWDLIINNGSALSKDLFSLSKHGKRITSLPSSSVLGRDLFCHKNTYIEPFCLLDTRDGPIYLDNGVEVRSHSMIRGPIYIGKETVVMGGEVGPESVIMEGCKVHGECSESIMMAHSNISHASLIARSYISQWVNVGAGTITSELKNSYGPVRVRREDGEIDTGLMKLGCAIADHVKLSAGVKINPGTSLGVASQIYGEGLGCIPSFSMWADGNNGESKELKLKSALTTQRRVMSRRNLVPNDREEKILREVYRRTRPEREINGIMPGIFTLERPRVFVSDWARNS